MLLVVHDDVVIFVVHYCSLGYRAYIAIAIKDIMQREKSTTEK